MVPNRRNLMAYTNGRTMKVKKKTTYVKPKKTYVRKKVTKIRKKK